MSEHRAKPFILEDTSVLSSRAYSDAAFANSWEELWEAGPYYDRVSQLLEAAERYVVFVGWQIDSRLCLRGSSSETFREKVIRICEGKPRLQIYFLIWDHSYLYIPERETWQGRIWEDVHPQVHFVFDNRHPFGGSHHEKVCLFDGKIALCGGIDLCADRWDSPQHLYSDKRRSLNQRAENHGPYHDLAVQVTGPICKGIQDHVAERWRAVSSIPFPNAEKIHFCSPSSLRHLVYLSRTVVQVDQNVHDGLFVREIEFLFRDLIQVAEKRIILEGQYYWSETVNDMLISKIHQMRGKDFEIIIILADLQFIKSLTRYMTGYELNLLRKLELAAHYAGIKLTVGYPFVYAPENVFLHPKSVYIHSKTLVIDDRFLGIGSANLATRALRIDTEIQLTLEARTEKERSHIRYVANSILDHWQIGRTLLHSQVGFRAFKTQIELNHLRNSIDRVQFVPWQGIFDPSVPWFFRLRIRIYRMIRKLSRFRYLVEGLFFSLLLVFVGAGTGPGSDVQYCVIIYGVLLSLVGLIPLPFTGISILAGLQLGPVVSSGVSASAVWLSSAIGYSLARSFPDLVGRYFREIDQKSVRHRLGLRSFAMLLLTLMDPCVSMRAKIICQGLCCIPLPWFLFGMGIIIPSIVFTLMRWGLFFVFGLVPVSMIEFLKAESSHMLLGIIVLSGGRSFYKVWKNQN